MTTRRELQTRVNTLAAQFSDVKEERDAAEDDDTRTTH